MLSDMPKGELPENNGIDEPDVPPGFGGRMLYPLRCCAVPDVRKRQDAAPRANRAIPRGPRAGLVEEGSRLSETEARAQRLTALCTSFTNLKSTWAVPRFRRGFVLYA
jgi:hypothetical protein